MVNATETNGPFRPKLTRAIGRWSLVALMLNGMIGSGIFGLPSVIAGLLNRWSPIAYLAAAGGCGVIMACFAEVASRFNDAGGAYLYAHAALGRFAGIQVGWMSWLVCISRVAANANLFVMYLTEFWPAANRQVPRIFTLILILGILAAINYRGTRGGTTVSDVTTVAKIMPMVFFTVVGGFYLLRHQSAAAASVVPHVGNWLQAVLLLAFAFGGFEIALMPMGEVKNPMKDAPFALFVALVVVTLIYISIQIVYCGVFPFNHPSPRPLAEAAKQFLGTRGSILMSAGALVSLAGVLSANLIAVPRLTLAMARQRDFPSVFGKIHPQFHTPYVSILAFAGMALVFAIAQDFRWNVAVSAAARLFTYGAVCVTLIVLRRKDPVKPKFHLPGGVALAVIGVLFALLLMRHMGITELLVLIVTALIAFLHWVAVVRSERRRPLGLVPPRQ